MKTYGEMDYRVALNFCVFFFHDPQQKKEKKSSHEKKNSLHCRNYIQTSPFTGIVLNSHDIELNGAHLFKVLEPSLSLTNKTKLETKHSEITR